MVRRKEENGVQHPTRTGTINTDTSVALSGIALSGKPLVPLQGVDATVFTAVGYHRY
jgi:hypothetical protein